MTQVLDPIRPIAWPKGKPKILVWDIEAMSFNFSPAMGELLCVAFQHPDWKQPRVVRYDDFNAADMEIEDRDFYLCEWLAREFLDVEILIGHYAYGFDRPFVTARMMYHGFQPFVQTQEIDTFKIARKNFKGPSGRFGSHEGMSCSLKNLAKFLRLPQQKGGLSPTEWRQLMTNDYPELMTTCADYCKQDVWTTLVLFNRLKALPGFPVNLALAGDWAGMRCTACASMDLQARGTRTTATQQYQRYRCNRCGKWSRGRTSCLPRGGKHLMPL